MSLDVAQVPVSQVPGGQASGPAKQVLDQQPSIRGHSLGEWARMLRGGEVDHEWAVAALPKLIELLRSESVETREEARSCLIAMNADAAPAVPVLVELLAEQRRVIGKMATLRQIGSVTVPKLLRDESTLAITPLQKLAGGDDETIAA